MKIVAILSMSIFLISFGCAKEKQVSYWDLPTTKRPPANEKELHEECLRIRQEIIRQQALASMVKGFLANAAKI